LHARGQGACEHTQQFIVRAYDVRTLPNGQIYIVMEYLEGEDLNALVRREGTIPWRRSAKMIRMICAGLAAAHKRQLLHRDIKPQNCFRVTLDEDPDHIKLIDFGIAKDVTADHEITETGMILGTPEYMAPELMDERCVPDPRSDLYAVGITLYKLLTGTVPFTGRNAFEVCARHSNDPVIPPSQRKPALGIPPAADLIVLRALAKDPSQRYQTALDMIRDIEASLARSPTGPLPIITTEDLAAPPAIILSTQANPTRRPFARVPPPIVPAPTRRAPIVAAPPPPHPNALAPAPTPSPRSAHPVPLVQAARPAHPLQIVPAPADPAAPIEPDPLAPPELTDSQRPRRRTQQYTSPGSSSGPSLPIIIVSEPPTPSIRQVRKREVFAKLFLPLASALVFGFTTWVLAATRPHLPPQPRPESINLPPDSSSPASSTLAPQIEPEAQPVVTQSAETKPDATAQVPTKPVGTEQDATRSSAQQDTTRNIATSPARTGSAPRPASSKEHLLPRPESGFDYQSARKILKEQQKFIRSTCLVGNGAPDKISVHVVLRKDGEALSVNPHTDNAKARECLVKLVSGTVFPSSRRGAAFVYSHPSGSCRPTALPAQTRGAP